ncbi:hypothetical protein Tco_1578143 [Tanacetum coccineum]
MLKRGSYIPWASRFKRFLNRKRENWKWLLKVLEDGPYVFRNITPTSSILPRLQEVEDLQGDDLLYYDAEMELMNMILLSIPNEIYNSVDSCKTAKEMWARVKRLMRGTIQNHVDRETRFTNEFDQFVAEPGESLFLNSLQPEWLKYVTQVRLAKQLTVDSFDDLFDYLSRFEKLVNASRAKKLEKSHDHLPLVAHTGSSSRNTSSYYVTHPSSIVDYDEEYEQDDVHNHSEDPLASAMLLLAKAITQNFSNPTNNHLRASSNTRNQAVVQGDRVNIQSRNSGNVGRNNRRAYVQEEVVEECIGLDTIWKSCAKFEIQVPVYLAERVYSGRSFCLVRTRDQDYPHVDASSRGVNSAKTQKDIGVVQIVLWVVDSGCSKHMTGDRLLLRNFVEKFMGTVRFGNDNFAAIIGYGDYIHGNVIICHVYYVEGLGHNLEVPAQVRDQVPVYLAEGLILERKTTKEETERLISKAILQERGRMQAQISSQIQNAIDNAIPSLVDAFVRSYMSGHILHVHPAQVQSSSVPEQQHQLYLAMKADPLSSAVRTRDQDDPYDDAHPEGENSAKRQKTSEYEAYVSGESSSGQVNVEEPGLKSYYNDVKYGYVQKELTNDEVEFLKLFEEEIEVRLNYRDQMRRWEMYVNGRPLGPRRERPE